jgi:hypothetical protein
MNTDGKSLIKQYENRREVIKGKKKKESNSIESKVGQTRLKKKKRKERKKKKERSNPTTKSEAYPT